MRPVLIRSLLIPAAALLLAGCALAPAVAPAPAPDLAPDPAIERMTPEEARATLLALIGMARGAGVEIVDLGPEGLARLRTACAAAALVPTRYTEAVRSACAIAQDVGTPAAPEASPAPAPRAPVPVDPVSADLLAARPVPAG